MQYPNSSRTTAHAAKFVDGADVVLHDGDIAYGTELMEGRAQHAVVELLNWPTINLFNLYLHTAEGMYMRNAKIPMTIGVAMAGQRHPSIVGGDWNMDHDTVKASTFPVQAQIEMVTPYRATCRTATGLRAGGVQGGKEAATHPRMIAAQRSMQLFEERMADEAGRWGVRPGAPRGGGVECWGA